MDKKNIRKLRADEIECRVAQVSAKGCSLLLYKTARVDRAILDEVFGFNWQNDFKVIDGKMYGGIGIKVDNEWIWRWDCGTESNTEAEKGQASDCFKRAGFKWGIGVELYSAPFIWANVETEKDGSKYKLADKFLKFKVEDIGYADNGDINKLVIVDSKGNKVFTMGRTTSSPKKIVKDTNVPVKKEEPKQEPPEEMPWDNIPEEPEDKCSLDYRACLTNAKTMKELTTFYNDYRKEIEGNPDLKNLFKERRKDLLS